MINTLPHYFLRSGEGVLGSEDATKAGVKSTGGMFTCIESKTQGGAPRHVHSREDEYFYVVEGKLTVTIGHEVSEVGKGGFVFLPRNIPHEWDVVGDEATLLMMTVPAMLDEFLAEYHAAFSDGPEARNQVAEIYGITFL